MYHESDERQWQQAAHAKKCHDGGSPSRREPKKKRQQMATPSDTHLLALQVLPIRQQMKEAVQVEAALLQRVSHLILLRWVSKTGSGQTALDAGSAQGSVGATRTPQPSLRTLRCPR